MLRMSEIRRRTSLSVSHLYALITEGLFPPLVPFGARATGTPEVLVDAWLCARIDARDAMSSLHDPVVLPRWSPESVRVPALRAVRMLTLSEVEAREGMKKTSLYRAIASGAFPAPAPLTSNARRWPAHEIDAWVQTRIERSLREAMATRIPRFVPLLRGSWRIALGRVGLFRPTLGVMFSKLSERLFSDSWDDGAPFGPWIPNSLGLCARIGALIGALRSPSTFGFSQSGGDPSRGGRCQCP